ERTQLLPIPEPHDGIIDSFKTDLGKAIHAGRRCRRLDLNRSGREAYEQIYRKLNSQPAGGLLGEVTGRGSQHILRLAALTALLDQRKEVSAADIALAESVWRYSEDSARLIFGDRRSNPYEERLLRDLREEGKPLSRSEIRDMNKRYIGVLDGLVDEGLIETSKVQTRGRTATVYSVSDKSDKPGKVGR
ncbi:MAG: hypothetical protein AAFY60_12255, partial [Myxococcota bacterium]